MTASDTTAAAGNITGIRGGNIEAQTRCITPLVNSGSLDQFKHADLTPVIGREFTGVQVKDLINADQQLIKDLAITSKPVMNSYTLTFINESFGIKSQSEASSFLDPKISTHSR
jgi:hypothetical protein